VIPCIESVTAPRILRSISEVGSVSEIRDETSGEDFDIFEEGSLRDKTRRHGARDASIGSKLDKMVSTYLSTAKEVGRRIFWDQKCG